VIVRGDYFPGGMKVSKLRWDTRLKSHMRSYMEIVFHFKMGLV